MQFAFVVILAARIWGRVRFGAGHFDAGTIGCQNFFFKICFSVATLFRFVARFARGRIEVRAQRQVERTGSRSTAFQNCLLHCFSIGGIFHRRNFPGGPFLGGIFLGGIYLAPKNVLGSVLIYESAFKDTRMQYYVKLD